MTPLPGHIPTLEHARTECQTRRHFLGQATCSFGAAALSGMLNNGVMGSMMSTVAAAATLPHGRPMAKRVIYLHMAGSPPHHDLFDYKPLLNKRHGELAPVDCYAERSAFVKPNAMVLGTPFKFQQVGGNGAWVSELLPHFKEVINDVCIVRSMYTDQFNHAPAQLLLQTGHSTCRAGHRWARGCPGDLEVKTAIYPPSSCSSPGGRNPRRAHPPGTVGSSPPCTRAFNVAVVVIPSST